MGYEAFFQKGKPLHILICENGCVLPDIRDGRLDLFPVAGDPGDVFRKEGGFFQTFDIRQASENGMKVV